MKIVQSKKNMFYCQNSSHVLIRGTNVRNVRDRIFGIYDNIRLNDRRCGVLFLLENVVVNWRNIAIAVKGICRHCPQYIWLDLGQSAAFCHSAQCDLIEFCRWDNTIVSLSFWCVLICVTIMYRGLLYVFHLFCEIAWNVSLSDCLGTHCIHYLFRDGSSAHLHFYRRRLRNFRHNIGPQWTRLSLLIVFFFLLNEPYQSY